MSTERELRQDIKYKFRCFSICAFSYFVQENKSQTGEDHITTGNNSQPDKDYALITHNSQSGEDPAIATGNSQSDEDPATATRNSQSTEEELALGSSVSNDFHGSKKLNATVLPKSRLNMVYFRSKRHGLAGEVYFFASEN